MTMRIDTKTTSNPLRRRLRRLGAWERREEAIAFLDLHARESGAESSVASTRRRTVLRDLARHGWYEHTPEELAFGARVAWRHHARCIGRLFWQSLEVVDCRSIVEPEAIAQCVRRVRPFARVPGLPGAWHAAGSLLSRAVPAFASL